MNYHDYQNKYPEYALLDQRKLRDYQEEIVHFT